MIQPIIKDPIFLGQKSVPATKADLQVAPGFAGHFDRPPGRMRGYGRQHDWRFEAYHRV